LAIVGFRQLSLCVQDLEAACRFYADGLGFELGAVRHVAGPAAGGALGLAKGAGRAVLGERDALRIELFQPDPPAPVRGTGGAGDHLVFEVDDLPATLQSLRDRGVKIAEDTRLALAPGVASCFVMDPDGRRIELYQQPTEV
jgi:catechol 2,3-dioxygenase-like lactoylglutathione lyase family enzyme